MQKLVDTITRYCIDEELIKSEEAPWFRYVLAKKISTILVGIPFLILAFAISNFLSAISFFATYFFVRKYIGGFHAKTVLGCLSFSLLMELVFLGVLPYLITTPVLLGILGISVLAILTLAPYNHPNLHLTHEEKKACRKRGCKRICAASFIGAVACLTGYREIANGCTIGIAMATSLLCLGYIHDWRNTLYEKQKN